MTSTSMAMEKREGKKTAEPHHLSRDAREQMSKVVMLRKPCRLQTSDTADPRAVPDPRNQDLHFNRSTE